MIFDEWQYDKGRNNDVPCDKTSFAEMSFDVKSYDRKFTFC